MGRAEANHFFYPFAITMLDRMKAGTTIRRVGEGNIDDLLRLIEALARFERLAPPEAEANERLRAHALAERPAFKAFVAYLDGKPVGYITYYFTYSTFLAKPTLFLEDIFVLEEGRRKGVGRALFRFCAEEAVERGCGRMEWSVLTWNEGAIRFYESMGGRRLDWYLYRLDENGMRQALEDEASVGRSIS